MSGVAVLESFYDVELSGNGDTILQSEEPGFQIIMEDGGPRGEKGDTGNTGPVPWSAAKAWAASTSYVIGPPASLVTFGGSLYVCATAHKSGTAFDASKWTLMASKGDKGDTGDITPELQGLADSSTKAASAALLSEQHAAASETAAASSSDAAAKSASAANDNKVASAASADAARGSKEAAADSAAAADERAAAAATSATDAQKSADASAESADAAHGSEEAVAASAKAAHDSEEAAAASADSARGSAEASASSAGAAKDSENASAASASAAHGSEDAAAKSAVAAKNSETAASTSATAAQGSADASANSAANSKGSEDASAASASAAASSEKGAASSAAAAKGSENASAASAAAAQTSEENSAAHDAAAENARDAARASADAAGVSAGAASDSADAAHGSEEAASGSAAAAHDSADAASGSATAANDSAQAAAGSAGAAHDSEKAAAASATAASGSASAAATSAAEAKASEESGAGYAAAAKNSQDAANASAEAAAQSEQNASGFADRAEAAAKEAETIADGGVLTFANRAGHVVPEQGDYDEFYYPRDDVDQALAGKLNSNAFSGTSAIIGGTGTGYIRPRELAAVKNVANGYAGLDADGKVPAAQLPVAPVTKVAGRTGDIILVAEDIGDLPDVLAAKAPLQDPDFSGVAKGDTPVPGTSSRQFATTEFVALALASAVAGIMGGIAPETLDTINELAAKVQDEDSALAALITTVGQKLAKDQNLADLTDVATALTNLGASSIGKALFGAASQAAARSAIGAAATSDIPSTSGFMKGSNNLSELTSAASALSNLGISSFIKTLLDDTTAATARSTLGAAADADMPSASHSSNQYYFTIGSLTAYFVHVGGTTDSNGNVTFTFPRTFSQCIPIVAMNNSYIWSYSITSYSTSKMVVTFYNSNSYTPVQNSSVGVNYLVIGY
ncbi:hypothetical protein SAMN05216548_114135 [Faunimonas pinastri]|uniref:Uncharacterized protein n=1 Tax=Faunimonas pinastri TaxID=1855383 RepID=A0A1H9N198_9HYPH|nr:hypothetical protein [Faunimonas pinastri]SER29557.1 hypothetical protein SAMN05216548_114135 [Faunimonas pinastri]